jgi:hypothetical protein
VPRAQPFDPNGRRSIVPIFETERGASFFPNGGLAAVHAEGRDRNAIWETLERKEVYGTSGPRILLWFDLVAGPDGRLPMGGQVAPGEAPAFEVRAVGSLEQQPDYSERALGPDELERICRGECYHPSDRRRPITRIEVVRIRPQLRPDEDVATLVEDPWKVISCPRDPDGCLAETEERAWSSPIYVDLRSGG